MDEKKDTQGIQQGGAVANSNIGIQSETVTLIDKANAAAERLEKANARQAELISQQENIEARRMLGGQTNAGIQPPVQKEETPGEYSKRIMSGKI